MRTWLVQYYFLMFTDFTKEYLQHRYFLLFLAQVTEIRMKYFDTVPVAAAMCVLKTGFLFTASEFGNQYVLLINKLIIIPFCLNYSHHPSPGYASFTVYMLPFVHLVFSDFAITFNFNSKLMVVFARLYCGCRL